MTRSTIATSRAGRSLAGVALVVGALSILTIPLQARATIMLSSRTQTETAPFATPLAENGRIAFRRYFNNAHTHGAIFTINTDGTGLRQVTHRGKVALDTSPDWSPNGRWIVFQHEASACRPSSCQRNGLFKVRPNGTHLMQLDKDRCTSDGCPEDLDPSWSASGKLIAFDRAYGPVVGGTVAHLGLFVMRADGTHVRQVTQMATPTRYEDTTPQWSPDGSHLVFQRLNKATGQHAVFTVRLDGTSSRRLTPWGLDAGGNPDWSPNGRWILFQSHEPHNQQDNLFLVHPNGSDLHRITHTFGGTYTWFKQTFSPDGTMITVARGPAVGKAGNPDVYVMNVDGSGLRDITNSNFWESASDWGPRPT